MTTTRDLIQRLADELTNAIRVIHNEDGTHHISRAAPVLDEARAYLDQPKPKIVPRGQRPGRRNPFVSDFHEIKPERVEVIPTDYALAYSALARRVAAIDAILRTHQWPEQFVREETDAAMATIQQVETLQYTIPTAK
jgi:hypothetical protein